jgi:hypothetical protein
MIRKSGSVFKLKIQWLSTENRLNSLTMAQGINEDLSPQWHFHREKTVINIIFYADIFSAILV